MGLFDRWSEKYLVSSVQLPEFIWIGSSDLKICGRVLTAGGALHQRDLGIVRGGRGGQFGFSRTIVSPRLGDRREGRGRAEQWGELLLHWDDW